MTDIRTLTQNTLAGVDILVSYGLHKGNDDEYIVYTQADSPIISRSDGVEVNCTGISVKYYLKDDIVVRSQGKAYIFEQTCKILSAMDSAGFICETGVMDLGDIDDIGYSTFVMDFNYSEVI